MAILTPPPLASDITGSDGNIVQAWTQWYNDITNNAGKQVLRVIQGEIEDVSTAQTLYRHIPWDCVLKEMHVVIDSEITVQDSIITLTNVTKGTSIGSMSIVAEGSETGSLHSKTDFNGALDKDDVIKVAVGGESTSASIGQFNILLELI